MGTIEFEKWENALFTRIPMIPLESAVTRRFGIIRAQLARQGTPIGMNDLWIAAHTHGLGLILVTDNDAEFLRVP